MPANATSFQKGRRPWNYYGTVAKNCAVCNAEYKTKPSLAATTSKYCSRACAYEGRRRNSAASLIWPLVEQGLSGAQIAEQLGIPRPTVYWHVNRLKYRFRQPGLSRSAVTKKFLAGRACALCGYDRFVEAAHVIPAASGGTMEEDNLLALCPNHHRLFDRGALNDEERARMDEVAPNWKQHRARR